MEEEERSSFEQELKDNLLLRQQLEEVQTLVEGIETVALKEKLNTYHEEISVGSSTFKSARIGFKNYAMAASIAIFIGIATFWFFNRKSPEERLFAKHFVPDPGLPTTMGNSTNFAFYDAMVSYKRADYATAITKWETLLNEKPSNDTLNYFIGVAHLANTNADEAIKYLNVASQSKNSVFDKDMIYYLGMANLKAGNLETAKKYLSESDSNNAKTILDELKL